MDKAGEHQTKEFTSKRQSLGGLTGMFNTRFSMWDAKPSEYAGTEYDNHRTVEQQRSKSNLGGKMMKLLSPKVGRTQQYTAADEPVAGSKAYLDSACRDSEVAKSWPAPATPQSAKKPIWRRLGRGKKADSSSPTAVSRDQPPCSFTQDSDSCSVVSHQDSDTKPACDPEEGADGDSYYSYSSHGTPMASAVIQSPFLPSPADMDVDAQQTIDLSKGLSGFEHTTPQLGTPGMATHGCDDIFTPSFMAFAREVHADVGEEPGQEPCPLFVPDDDITTVMVSAAQLASAGGLFLDSQDGLLQLQGGGVSAATCATLLGTPTLDAAAGTGSAQSSPGSLESLVKSTLKAPAEQPEAMGYASDDVAHGHMADATITACLADHAECHVEAVVSSEQKVGATGLNVHTAETTAASTVGEGDQLSSLADNAVPICTPEDVQLLELPQQEGPEVVALEHAALLNQADNVTGIACSEVSALQADVCPQQPMQPDANTSDTIETALASTSHDPAMEDAPPSPHPIELQVAAAAQQAVTSHQIGFANQETTACEETVDMQHTEDRASGAASDSKVPISTDAASLGDDSNLLAHQFDTDGSTDADAAQPAETTIDHMDEGTSQLADTSLHGIEQTQAVLSAAVCDDAMYDSNTGADLCIGGDMEETPAEPAQGNAVSETAHLTSLDAVPLEAVSSEQYTNDVACTPAAKAEHLDASALNEGTPVLGLIEMPSTTSLDSSSATSCSSPGAQLLIEQATVNSLDAEQQRVAVAASADADADQQEALKEHSTATEHSMVDNVQLHDDRNFLFAQTSQQQEMEQSGLLPDASADFDMADSISDAPQPVHTDSFQPSESAEPQDAHQETMPDGAQPAEVFAALPNDTSSTADTVAVTNTALAEGNAQLQTIDHLHGLHAEQMGSDAIPTSEHDHVEARIAPLSSDEHNDHVSAVMSDVDETPCTAIEPAALSHIKMSAELGSKQLPPEDSMGEDQASLPAEGSPDIVLEGADVQQACVEFHTSQLPSATMPSPLDASTDTLELHVSAPLYGSSMGTPETPPMAFGGLRQIMEDEEEAMFEPTYCLNDMVNAVAQAEAGSPDKLEMDDTPVAGLRCTSPDLVDADTIEDTLPLFPTDNVRMVTAAVPSEEPKLPSDSQPPSHSRRSPGPRVFVRESIPLFTASTITAAGSMLDDEDLDDVSNVAQARASIGTAAASLRAAAMARAPGVAARASLLGGAQRVAALNQFVSSLAPVREGSLTSAGSPGSERSLSPGIPQTGSTNRSGGSGGSARSFSPYVPSPDAAGSPLQPRRIGGSAASLLMQAGSAGKASSHLGYSPSLSFKGSPSSSQATPTLGNPGSYTAVTITPQSMATADMSDMSGFGSGPTCAARRGFQPPVVTLPSPAMALPDATSPTMMLCGQDRAPLYGQVTPSGAGTPGLLDRNTSSPSLVYSTNLTQTPYRQMAALPVDLARHAPLSDTSPFTPDAGDMDTICLADEAKRVAFNLGKSSLTPPKHAQPADRSMPQPVSEVIPPQPDTSAQLREMQQQILVKRLADAEGRIADLEHENMRLTEQVETMEFEKNEMANNDDFEQEARLYAEDQLQQAQAEIAAVKEQLQHQQQLLADANEERHVLKADAERQQHAWSQERAQLEQQLLEFKLERDDALDKVSEFDSKSIALKSQIADYENLVGSLQQRVADLEADLAVKEQEVQDISRVSQQDKISLQKAVEAQLSAQVAAEHAKERANRQAAEDQQKLHSMHASYQELQQQLEQLQAKYKKDITFCHQKYNQKKALLAQLEQQVKDKEAENQELMAMCDQLLAQQESGK